MIAHTNTPLSTESSVWYNDEIQTISNVPLRRVSALSAAFCLSGGHRSGPIGRKACTRFVREGFASSGSVPEFNCTKLQGELFELPESL